MIEKTDNDGGEEKRSKPGRGRTSGSKKKAENERALQPERLHQCTASESEKESRRIYQGEE